MVIVSVAVAVAEIRFHSVFLFSYNLAEHTEVSKLRATLYRVVREDGEPALETIRELWAHSNKTQQQVMTAELKQFARTESGESQRSAEPRKG